MRSGFIGHKWQDASQMRLGTMPLLRKFIVRKGRFVWTGQNIIIATVVTSHDQVISAKNQRQDHFLNTHHRQHCPSSPACFAYCCYHVMCFVFPILTWCILVLNSAKKKPFRPSRLDTLLQTPVQANTVTFNTIETVLDASGQWAMATLLLDLMGLSTVKPDPQSFNIATQLHSFLCHCERSAWQLAEKPSFWPVVLHGSKM